jgi:amino acid permease
MRSQLRRNIGLGGLLFIVLFVISSVIAPEPSSRASASSAAAKYAAHTGALAVNAYVIVVAVAVGLAFFWYLRELLAETPSVRRLATIGYGGVIIFAVSGGLTAGIEFSLSDVSNHVSPTTIQTLNVLNTDVSGVLGAGGVAAFLLATGIAVTRSAPLPNWLGWIAVVLGVAVLALPFASGPGAGIWVLIASIVLLVTREPAASAAPTTGS